MGTERERNTYSFATWNAVGKVFWLGLFGYQASNDGYDYWIDDVVVHSQRIGCPTAR